MAKTEPELAAESPTSTEEMPETVELSDEERIDGISKDLKKWQMGAAVCFLLGSVLLGVGITQFLSEAAPGGEELVSLEMLPNNRANNLVSEAKAARNDASKIEKKLETMLAGEDVVAVLTDAPKTMLAIIESENQFLESIVEYGRAIDSMTVLIGGAKEWNYGFQETLKGFEKRTRSRINTLEAMVERFSDNQEK